MAEDNLRLNPHPLANPDLVAALYGFLSDPDGFQHFFDSLRSHLLEHPEAAFPAASVVNLSDAYTWDPNQPIEASPSRRQIEYHFECAAAIFDRIGQDAPRPQIQGSVLSSDEISLSISPDGKISAANEAAHAYWENCLGTHFNTLFEDEGTTEAIRHMLSNQHKGSENAITVAVAEAREADPTPPLFLLQPHPKDTGLLLSSCSMGWNPSIGSTLATSFGLSLTEMEILRCIVEGKSFNQIAKDRKRSIETVRTQAKSLLRKTGAKSQIGLVRLFAAICISYNGEEYDQVGDSEKTPQMPTSSNIAVKSERISVGQGRFLQVDRCGSHVGLPVIMLHGLFSGTGLTAATRSYIASCGFQILAPWRPGYANSTVFSGNPSQAPDLFAKDIKALLDHYGFDKVVIMGRFTGAIYAAAAGQYLGDRAHATVLVSPTLPVVSKQQLRDMRGWQQVFAYAITYTPAVVPILVRGMRQFLFRKKTDQFMQGFYSEPQADIELRSTPDVQQVIESGVHNSFLQDTKGHERDLLLTGSDWSRYLSDIASPVLVIHGAKDPLEPEQRMSELIAKYNAFKVKSIKDAGQLYVHTDNQAVWGNIHRFLKNPDEFHPSSGL